MKTPSRDLLLAVTLAATCAVSIGCGRKDASRTPAARTPAQGSAVDRMIVAGIEQGKRGGTIVVGAVVGPKSLNPFTANEASSIEVISRIFDGLVELDCATGEIKPALATRWEISPDGRRWTFHLRRGVAWADGAPFTADDVLWNFQVLYDDSVAATSRENFTLDGKPFVVSKGTDGEGETIVIETPRPFGPLLSGLATALFLVPKHRWDGAYRAHRFGEALGIDAPADSVFGTGPFRLTKIDPDRTLLSRNTLYWKSDSAGIVLPYADTIVFVIAGDWNVWRMKFDAGEVDQYIAKPAEVAWLRDDAAASPGGSSSYRVVDLGPRLGSNSLWINQNSGRDGKGRPLVDPVKLGWFRDLRFRKAVVHAIDRDAIVRTVFNGFGTVIDGPISPSDLTWFNARLTRFAFDPARSRSLFAEIGFGDANDDGVLEDSSGHKAAFTILTNAENPVRIAMGQLVVSDLRAVGIAATLEVLEFNTLVSRIQETKRYEACLLALTGGGDPGGGMDVWLSSGQLHQFNPSQAQPATEWERAVDSLATASIETVVAAERKRLFDRVQELYAENLGWIFLANENAFLAVRDRFGNVRPGSLRAFNEFCWNEDEIFIR